MQNSQSKNIYPHFAKIAKDEGFSDISEKLELIAKVEYEHSVILATLDKLYNTKKLYKSAQAKIWKCSNCGNEKKSKQAWQECPLCTYPQGYVEIDLNHCCKEKECEC